MQVCCCVLWFLPQAPPSAAPASSSSHDWGIYFAVNYSIVIGGAYKFFYGLNDTIMAESNMAPVSAVFKLIPVWQTNKLNLAIVTIIKEIMHNILC